MAKWAAAILAGLLIITNGFWLYSALDSAATEKYRQIDEYESRNRIEVLKAVCSKLISGMQKAEAMKLLNELSPKFEAYEKEGRLNTIWLSFKVDQQGNVAKTGACE